MNKRDIDLEVERLGSLKLLVQAYSEIAASRVLRLRGAILLNREFMDGLIDVYSALRVTYGKEITAIARKRNRSGKDGLSLTPKNGKNAFVFLSANTGLYGDLIRSIYQLFKNETAEATGDYFISGRLGAALFREDNPKKDFEYFELPDHKSDPVVVKKLSKILVKYEKVEIYYGRFESIVSQKPFKSVLSGEEVKATRKISGVSYLFEPSLEKILHFFESELFSSLFVQTIYENLLSKFAARMLDLDASSERIKTSLQKVELEDLRYSHRLTNRKQLDSLVGLSLWKKE